MFDLEIVCVQYKRGNSSLYLIFLLICQFIIECSDVDAFVAALDIELLHYLIRFLWLFRVERLLIGHYHWEWLFSLLFFLCKQFWFDIFFLLLSVNRKDDIQSKSFVWISIAWNFQSVIFLMQLIKRNFWWHTCLSHFLGNWFDIKLCCTSLC